MSTTCRFVLFVPLFYIALGAVNPVPAEVIFDWVPIGNANNAADSTGFGSVDYEFLASQYEVTNAQYTEFLNAVDAAGTNPHGVYEPNMGTDARGGIAFDDGAAHGTKYSARANMGNKPVNFINFYSAMRFVNWLENGQPTNGTGTETGVYGIDGGINETRAPGASYFILNENEWYKAAYYNPSLGDYALFPTQSNTSPALATATAVGDIANPGANIANYDFGADWNAEDGNVTSVGTAGTDSASYYATFDQGGNVWEWTEGVVGSSRVLRGGAWNASSTQLEATHRSEDFPSDRTNSYGFRIGSALLESSQPVPEPTTMVLALLALLLGIGCARLGRHQAN